jgi:hypothetical protein
MAQFVGEQLTFADLFQRTEAVLAGALKHSEVPFEKIYDKLTDPSHRAINHSPFFQVQPSLQAICSFVHSDRLSHLPN